MTRRETSKLFDSVASLSGKIAARELAARHGLHEEEPNLSRAWAEILRGIGELLLAVRDLERLLIPLENYREALQHGREAQADTARDLVSALSEFLEEYAVPRPGRAEQLKVGGDSGHNPPP